ncbi:MAG: ABC transporter permease [Candidatus Margulisbacteria bacterium]|nr:ABC transporter permease [Candidatus Margulisiibacteriota bacterium]MBU1021143.1 ABC transporter permease [Candidatus Margulisiibacteriota bacterium]MBU1729749.1 ABC transporter permease [Candidatus Margulisiibacteriota bacterium]MBU1955250.1 ABC transporter permease [Candidatus Margulisiibacteriota bacterium]
MKTYWQVAARNVWRQKRRSILNIIAISVNIFAIVAYTSFYRGWIVNSFQNITDYQTGHVQIHANGFLKEERRAPLDINIEKSLDLKEKIKKLPKVTAVARRIEFAGSVSNMMDTINVMGVAIEPEDEAKIFVRKDAIIEGSYLKANDEGILIGDKLAKNLNVGVGDYLNLYSQTKFNTHNLVEVEIKGIFSYGFDYMDKNFVFIPLKLADQFLDMGGDVNEMVISAGSHHKTIAAFEEINTALSPETLKKIEVSPWTAFAQGVMEDIESDSISMVILFGILVAMAIFGIINTMSMNVMERSREIGTLRAIGITRKGISRIFLYEAIITGIIAILIGWFFGSLLSAYLTFHGLPMPAEFFENVNVPVDKVMYGVPGITEYIGTGILGLVAALIGGYFPARKAAKMKVVDALNKI